jgi:hypothetical protein
MGKQGKKKRVTGKTCDMSAAGRCLSQSQRTTACSGTNPKCSYWRTLNGQ